MQHDGVFYLPYRLHGTPAQMHAAYPMADDFFAARDVFDPNRVFGSYFATAYSRE